MQIKNMKKQTFLIAVAFLFSIQTKAQNNIPPNNVPQANIPPRTVVEQPNVTPHLFNVTNVTLSVDSVVSTHVTAPVATKHYFKATITSIGTGTIQYRWVLTGGGTGPNNQPYPPSIQQGTMQLNGSGTDLITTERQHVNANPANMKFLTLIIDSPNNVQSNRITF
jgi:hypothetical protein